MPVAGYLNFYNFHLFCNFDLFAPYSSSASRLLVCVMFRSGTLTCVKISTEILRGSWLGERLFKYLYRYCVFSQRTDLRIRINRNGLKCFVEKYSIR